MRELKFRAWTGDEMVNVCLIDWDGGTFWPKPCIMDQRNDIHLFEDGVIIEQFTGLKDKNGVEIYHNDLVKDQFGFVKRVESYFAEFILRDHDVSYKLMDYSKMAIPGIASNLEVIGNIHQNQDLLK